MYARLYKKNIIQKFGGWVMFIRAFVLIISILISTNAHSTVTWRWSINQNNNNAYAGDTTSYSSAVSLLHQELKIKAPLFPGTGFLYQPSDYVGGFQSIGLTNLTATSNSRQYRYEYVLPPGSFKTPVGFAAITPPNYTRRDDPLAACADYDDVPTYGVFTGDIRQGSISGELGAYFECGFAAPNGNIVWRAVTTICPAYYNPSPANGVSCAARDMIFVGVIGTFVDEVDQLEANIGDSECNVSVGQQNAQVGNPINLAIGNKFQNEIDYVDSSKLPLSFERYYNSINSSSTSAGFGNHWSHTFSRHLKIFGTSSTSIAQVVRDDGSAVVFVNDSGAGWAPQSDQNLGTFSENTDGSFSYSFDGITVERYSSNGLLESVTRPFFGAYTLSYDAQNNLQTISDSFGRTLQFTYNTDDKIESITAPDNLVVAYGYNSNGILETVTYDGTDTRTYHYEDPNFGGALTGITNENSDRVSTWEYDISGRAILSEGANGTDRVDIAYNSDGSATVTDVLGASRTYSFINIDGVMKVSGITGDECNSCGNLSSNITYDANGFPASKIDWEGNQTDYIYDAKGLEISRTEAVGTPDQRTITTQYLSGTRLPRIITEPGKELFNNYNGAGFLTGVFETDLITGNTRSIGYPRDSEGDLIAFDGYRGDVDDSILYEYDSMGNRSSASTDPDDSGPKPAHVTNFTSYDNSGRLLSMTDPNGYVTDMTYDARGRLLTSTIAAGSNSAATTTFEYDGVGNATKIILPSLNELNYTYDAAQRLTRITDRQGHYIQYTLDNLGNRTQEDVFSSGDVLRRTQSRVFDQLSRMIQSIGGENQLTVFGYDGNGNQVSKLDPLGRNSTSEYDSLQRLIKQTDADTNDTLYAYDTQDNLTQVTDPRGIVTSYTYDGFNFLTQLDSKDTGITIYTNDDAGNRTSKTSARNILTNYHYDSFNRLTQIEYPGAAGLNVDFEYDTGTNRVGRLYRVLDNTGAYIYYYNKRGEVSRLRRNTQGSLYDIRYFYDKAGNVTKIEYPSGKTIQYVYNSIKRVREVRLIDGGTTTNLATGIVYRQFGPMQKLIYGNGLINTIGYDLDYRARNNRVLPVQDLRFFYDAANNITDINDIVEPSKHQDFIYDNLDRLTSADGGYGVLSYTYDEVGNRLTRSDPANTNTYTINATRNRINNYSDSAGNLIDYNHNATGSVTKIDTDTYSYNRYERMSVATVDGVATTYRYDGKGQRTVKTDAAGVKTIFIFDNAGQLISENQADGTTIREYVYLNGQPLAMLESGNIYYYHNDHLGTPQKMTDSAQIIVWQADYNPFGAATLVTNTVTNNIRLPGQYFDTESGLHYNYFRDYSPADGRYIQADPVGINLDFSDPQFQILLSGGTPLTGSNLDYRDLLNHLYGYANQNPLTNVDFYGLTSCAARLKICRVQCARKLFAASTCMINCEGTYGALSNCEDDDDEEKPEPEKEASCPTQSTRRT